MYSRRRSKVGETAWLDLDAPPGEVPGDGGGWEWRSCSGCELGSEDGERLTERHGNIPRAWRSYAGLKHCLPNCADSALHHHLLIGLDHTISEGQPAE